MKLRIPSDISAKYINVILIKVFKILLGCAFVLALALQRGVGETLIFALSLAVHEGFHMLSAMLLKIDIKSFGASLFGFKIEIKSADVSGFTSLLLFLSGPLGNALFALGILFASTMVYIRQVEFFILYNLIIAAVNMIPAYPLDAARALEGIITEKCGRLRSVRIVSYISYLIALVMFGLGLYIAVFASDNLLLMALALFIILATKKELNASEMDALMKAKDSAIKNASKLH